MSPAYWFWTHLSFVLLGANLIAAWQRKPSTGWSRLIGVAVPAVLAIIPFRSTDICGFLLGHIDTLSVPTVLILSLALAARWFSLEPWQGWSRHTANLVWVAGGIFLYPSALGFLEVDTYVYGYRSSLAWGALALSLMAMVLRQEVLAFCLLASVLAHQFHLLESPNLWDYLLDPWLCLAAMGQLLIGAWQNARLPQVRTSPTARVVGEL